MNINATYENPTNSEVVDSFLLKQFLDTYITTRNLEFIENGVKFYLYIRDIEAEEYTHYTVTFTGPVNNRLLINAQTLYIRQNKHNKSVIVNFQKMENNTNMKLIEALDNYDEFAQYRSSNGRPTSYQFTSTEKLLEFLTNVEPYV